MDLMTNPVKDYFSGVIIQHIVDFLMEVFYNSLRFHLIHSTMLPPENRTFIWVLIVKRKIKSRCERVNVMQPK